MPLRLRTPTGFSIAPRERRAMRTFPLAPEYGGLLSHGFRRKGSWAFVSVPRAVATPLRAISVRAAGKAGS